MKVGQVINSYIYLNKINDFIRTQKNIVVDTFKQNFFNIYGEYPDIEQIKAWESSIDFLQNALNDPKLYKFDIVFEYRLPFSNERIDTIIFGEQNAKPTAIIFETKGWTFAKNTQESEFVIISDLGKSIHPEYQVENYIGKLKFSHSMANIFDFIGCVLMYNASKSKVEIGFKRNVFFKNNVDGLRIFISNSLNKPLNFQVIVNFLKGTYIQNKNLFDSIRKHYDQIASRSYDALAESGWGLSNEQLDLIEEIMKDLSDGKKDIIYLVQGAPGSGKTLVAIHLLLSSLKRKYQTILAYRNNRLINSIRDIFNSIKRGLANPIKFYSVGPRAGFKGVAEKNFSNGYLDLVIYDEAQRMTKENIHYAMQRGKIAVFFYDEGQILNTDEEGFTKNFKIEAKKLRKHMKERFLNGFYRVAGGKVYHNFVETLITNPTSITKEMTDSWKNLYDFRVFTKIENLLEELQNRKNEGNKVALIAAFTESPGDLRKPTSTKNLRIGYPLYSGFDLYSNFQGSIYWLMDPKSDYVPFWVKGMSNNLDRCASIYGCQGFETDYAGVIWGRDYVIRNGNWEFGNNCEDNVGKPSLKDLFNKAKRGDQEAYQQAKQLFINRYRIFLTRGIKGTYIFCEDERTAEFLKTVYNKYVIK